MDVNPWQAPTATTQLPYGSGKGIWRDGQLLVVQQQATLPPTCVKNNTPAHQLIERKFHWHAPWIYWLAFLPIFFYVIAALVMRKKHVLSVPMSDEASQTRSNRIAFGWIAGVIGFSLSMGGVFAMLLEGLNLIQMSWAIAAVIVGTLFVMAGAVVGSNASYILRPKKMTTDMTWFSGAHPDFLLSLPQIPR